MTHRWRRSRRRLLSFVPLLAMASTASALNLSQFQIITSSQIPKRCIRAYQTDIEGCTTNDFMGGRQCSASCVKGLQQEQALIEAVCGDLNVSPRSLLGIVLSGDLVDILCPGYSTTTVTKTIPPSSSTIDGFSTVKATSTPTSDTTKASLTTPPKTTPTSDSSTTEQSTTDRATPTPSSTTDNGGTASPSSADTTPTQDTAQSSVTSEPAQSSSSDDDTPTPFVGGSPFDPAPIEGLGAKVYPGFCTKALTAVVFAAMLILR
ncbi:hypothetical protein F5Y05DRAFT_29888 [Hypoxylon sp. FL0543]|nr:hypothetical protein F5Y05DRAFT_29888 [Hypoxylon sp. FL0543]